MGGRLGGALISCCLTHGEHLIPPALGKVSEGIGMLKAFSSNFHIPSPLQKQNMENLSASTDV